MAALPDSAQFYIGEDNLYYVPDGFVGGSCLVISRKDFSYSVEAPPVELVKLTSTTVYGIMGCLDLLLGPYLILISDRRNVCNINGNIIYRVTKSRIQPLAKTAAHLNQRERDAEKYFQNLLEFILIEDGFYYSNTYDISHTLQRIELLTEEEKRMPMWKRADERFLWNHHLTMSMIKGNVGDWATPIVRGFFSSEHFEVDGKRLSLILAGRRSAKRAGTRYTRRGADVEGNVANFVETEQIVAYPNHFFSSFVQTRGSVPVVFTQRVNLKYKPPTVISSSTAENHDAFSRHIKEQISKYGMNVFVSLLAHHGSEGRLTSEYEARVQKLDSQDIRLIPFDFHKECKNMRYDRLDILMTALREDVDKHGYIGFKQLGADDMVMTKKQLGVVRTNCLDSLDRTNVTQSLIARYVLVKQLSDFGLLKGENLDENTLKLKEHAGLDKLLKNMWTSHGDVISSQYSGTGALKSDYTRTGKRTFRGMLDDGTKSLLRYYLNNFKDGQRQDALDLFTGEYVTDRSKPSPLLVQPLSFTRYGMLVVFFCWVVSLVTRLMGPRILRTRSELNIVIWGFLLYLGFKLIQRFGRRFVNVSRLTKPE